MSFDAALFYVAVDFADTVAFELFNQGELMYASKGFLGGGVGLFGGLLSSEPFDAIRMFDFIDNAAFIDDLYFGSPIPAAPALALLALGGVISGKRRTRLR